MRSCIRLQIVISLNFNKSARSALLFFVIYFLALSTLCLPAKAKPPASFKVRGLQR